VLLNHAPERTRIAIVTEYQVYLDDSGHPDGQPYVVVAGFLSTEPKWIAFELAWKAALKRNCLGTVFHMTDFMCSGGTKKQKGVILDDLTTVIHDHAEAALTVMLDMDAYKRVNESYALEECMGKPFALTARAVAVGINTWKRNFMAKGDHLLIFIEEGTKHRGDMEATFRRDRLPIPQTVPKRHPAAQAADMLAWESFHFARYEEPRRSLINLLKDRLPCNDLEGKFNEHNLLTSCKNAGVPLRDDVPPNVGFVFHSSPKQVRKRTIK
jgi:hypothetical protein